MIRTSITAFVFWLGMLLLGVHALGQMPAFKLLHGTRPPDSGKPGIWFHNPKEPGQIFAFHDGDWVNMRLARGEHPKEKGGFVWIKNGLCTAIATIDGRLLIERAYRLQPFGELLVGATDDQEIFALHPNGDTLSYFSNQIGRAPVAFQKLMDGTLVYCLPAYAPIPSILDTWEIRGWGMLDGQGNWRTPPLFDDFFRFETGQAKVMHYGVVRTINERGEFVD